MKPEDNSTLEILERLRAESIEAGGAEKIKAQHDKGKLTARERLDLLLDDDSFEEVDMLKTGRGGALGDERCYPGDGVIIGHGTIDGREVFVFSQDFTVVGGSLGEAHSQKICKAMDLAVKVGAPTVEGATVTAKITGQHRSRKILVFRYRPKKRIRVRKGHRQHLTRLQIESINL